MDPCASATSPRDWIPAGAERGGNSNGAAPRTAAAPGPGAPDSRFRPDTGLRAASHGPAGRRQRNKQASCHCSLRGSPPRLPTGPREHGLSFPAATPSPPPWGSFEPQAGFRAGRRIPWLPSSHPLCPWLALKPFYCSKCQLGNKQGSNKITDEKADLRFYLIFKKLHF